MNTGLRESGGGGATGSSIMTSPVKIATSPTIGNSSGKGTGTDDVSCGVGQELDVVESTVALSEVRASKSSSVGVDVVSTSVVKRAELLEAGSLQLIKSHELRASMKKELLRLSFLLESALMVTNISDA